MISVQATDAEEDASDITTQDTFSFTTVIVFGEGPVKPVLTEEEVTSREKIAWYRYNADPSHFEEPDFWLMQQPRQLAELQKVTDNKHLTLQEKSEVRAGIRKKWQKNGWYAMKQWGRQNALAAGLALYKGLTKTVILSGGRTVSKEMKSLLPKVILDAWPSEAELMADIIKSTYGTLYEKKYGHNIDEAIKIENDATNTLENFAFTLNKYPELLSKDAKVGFLTAGHHLDRVESLAKLFSLNGGKLCAQDILRTMHLSEEESIGEAVQHIKEIASREEEIIKNRSLLKGLEDPTYLTFWLGYVATVKNPKVINNMMKRFDDPVWGSHGEKTFAKVGLKLEDYKGKDMVELAEKDITTFNFLVSKLQELKKPKYRVIPPILLKK